MRTAPMSDTPQRPPGADWPTPGPPGRASPDLGVALGALRPVVRALLGHVLAVVPGHADIDDCESEVYRRVVEGQSRLEHGMPLKPWVLGIARHVALDALRARRRAFRRAAGEPSGEDEEPLIERVADAAPGPEARVLLADRARRLDRALDRLPAEQRRVLLLSAEGLGYGEIAERVGAPLGTVCTWISRARQALKELLTEEREDKRR
jgi:RNA polymerase sigma factor (sigma-70 family)